jgi:hypothetical protein
MTARRSEAAGVGQIVIEVQVDRARQVPGRICRRAGTRLAQDPAAVDDPEVPCAGADEREQRVGGHQRVGHDPRIPSPEPEVAGPESEVVQERVRVVEEVARQRDVLEVAVRHPTDRRLVE